MAMVSWMCLLSPVRSMLIKGFFGVGIGEGMSEVCGPDPVTISSLFGNNYNTKLTLPFPIKVAKKPEVHLILSLSAS